MGYETMFDSFMDTSSIRQECELVHLDLEKQFHIPVACKDSLPAMQKDLKEILSQLRSRRLSNAKVSIGAFNSFYAKLPFTQSLVQLIAGQVMELEGKSTQARELYLLVQSNQETLAHFAYQMLADSYFDEGRFSLAEDYYLKAVSTRVELREPVLLHRSLQGLENCRVQNAA